MNIYTERYLKKLKDAGLCIRCRKPRDGKSTVFCEACAGRHRVYQMARYRASRAEKGSSESASTARDKDSDLCSADGAKDPASDAREQDLQKTSPPKRGAIKLPKSTINDTITLLERLASLKEKGFLTEEEFQTQKKNILAR